MFSIVKTSGPRKHHGDHMKVKCIVKKCLTEGPNGPLTCQEIHDLMAGIIANDGLSLVHQLVSASDSFFQAITVEPYLHLE